MSTPASASTWSPYSATPTNCSTQQSVTVTAVALFLYLGPHPYAARADLRGLPLGGAGPQKSLPHRRNSQSGPWSITYPEYLSGWAALRIGGNGKRPNHSRAHAETAGLGPQKQRRNTQHDPTVPEHREACHGWAALRIGGNGKRPNHSRAHAETAGLGPQRKRRSPERNPAAPQQRVGCSGWAALRIGEMESWPKREPGGGEQKATGRERGIGARG